MSTFEVKESDQFLIDLEEAAVWILLTNVEWSESFAEEKVIEFKADVDSLKMRLKNYPLSGEADEIQGLRKFPIHHGRYSAKWLVNYAPGSSYSRNTFRFKVSAQSSRVSYGRIA